MPKERLSAVEGYFTTLRHLYSESVTAGLTGGTYFDVQPDGKGTLTMTHKMVGPFFVKTKQLISVSFELFLFLVVQLN